jgi:hypothetical protein
MKLSTLCILAVLALMARPSFGAQQAQSTRPLALLQSRHGWTELEPVYLDAVASRFTTFEEALAFAELCERSGILENDIRPQSISTLSGAGETVIGTATALNQYGSTLASEEEFEQAVEAFGFAILLNRLYVPSYMGLASSHEGQREYEKAITVLDATPRTMAVGADTLDFAFELAFQKMMVLAAVLRDSRSPQASVALIAQMHEAKTLGQNSISTGFVESGIHGEDAVVGRRERLLFIDKCLAKLEP